MTLWIKKCGLKIKNFKYRGLFLGVFKYRGLLRLKKRKEPILKIKIDLQNRL